MHQTNAKSDIKTDRLVSVNHSNYLYHLLRITFAAEFFEAAIAVNGKARVEGAEAAEVVGAPRDRYFVVHVAPLGMVVALLSFQCHTRHPTESLM